VYFSSSRNFSTITGCNCLPSIAATTVSLSNDIRATIEFGFFVGASWPYGIKYIFLVAINLIRFTPFKPKASFVEIPKTTGRWFRNVALAAINTGESVKALANLLIELPVSGAMTIQSSGILGPKGSAFTIESITLFPVAFSIFSTHSAPSPKCVFVDWTVQETTGITSAPSFTSLTISGNTASYVQWDPVTPNPILFPFNEVILF